MLRVPWSKVTSIGDKLLQVLRVFGVFQGSILRDTARTRSISGMITHNTACTQSILGFDILKYWCTPSILGLITLEYSLYLQYLGIFTAPTFLSTRSTWAFRTAKTAILGVFQGFLFRCTSNTRSISRFHTPRYSRLEYYPEYLTWMTKYSWVQYSRYSEYSE